MTKAYLLILVFIIWGCEGNFLGKDENFTYGIKNSSTQSISIIAYDESIKVKTIFLNVGETKITYEIIFKEQYPPDPYFHPSYADSVVIEFADKKKVSYAYNDGIKKYPNLKRFGSMKVEQTKSKKWKIAIQTLIIINEDDYKLAK